MKFRFTSHAQYRIRERGLSIANIKQAILRPDLVESFSHDTVKVKKMMAGKTLIVVYSKNRNEYLIITSYYL